MKFPSKTVFLTAIIGGIIIYWLTNQKKRIEDIVSDDFGI